MPAWASEPGDKKKGRIFGCAFFLYILLIGSAFVGAAPARADIFSTLEGTYGDPWDFEQSCRVNPEHVRFADDRNRMTIFLDNPVPDYLGEWRTEAGYTILNHGEGSITMRLDDESRVTDAGIPLVWVMKPAVGIDGYCWGRTDWPAGRCDHLRVRCPASVPLG